jgi:hypothetical protein
VSRSKCANGSQVLPPKAGTFPSQTGSNPGAADVLAGESSTDDLHRFNGRPIDLTHVLVTGGVGPVTGEHLPAVRVLLDLPHRVTDTGTLEPKLQATDPGEQ